MKLILITIFLKIFTGCALTTPDGDKQLMKELEVDRNRQPYKAVYQGRPKFVKVRAYKKVQNGDVYGDHWIFLQVGREKLDLKKMVGGK